MAVALGAALIFSWLVSRVRPRHITGILATFFILCLAMFARVMPDPSGLTIWSFYLFGDLFSTVMVAAFFVVLNHSVTPEQAKHIYGWVGAGGVIGGVCGSAMTGFVSASPTTWIGVCALTTAAVGVVGSCANTTPESKLNVDPGVHASATEGVRLVLQSRYLLSIVCIVTIYEIVSTIMDFQFSATIAHYLHGAAIREQFARVYAISNVASLAVQLFLTRFVMKRYGVKAALLVLPLATLLGSVGFGALPILWMGSMLNTADSAFSYSIHQSAKESLYVPTSWAEKSKAKAFIDMFVLRFAKALAVGLTLAFTVIVSDFSAVRWLSVVTVALVVVWIMVARYAGEQFDELARVQNQ
jgi:AAA family ATP:ADP antiporter